MWSANRKLLSIAAAKQFTPGGSCSRFLATWIGMENIGKEHLTHIDVWSEPGFQEYMRAISVSKGEPITPLSKGELNDLRKKYSHYGIYQ